MAVLPGGVLITSGDAAPLDPRQPAAAPVRPAAGGSRRRLDKLIERHGAGMGLPELGDVLRGDCPQREAAAASERCSLYYPQLLRLWEQTGKSLDEL